VTRISKFAVLSGRFLYFIKAGAEALKKFARATMTLEAADVKTVSNFLYMHGMGKRSWQVTVDLGWGVRGVSEIARALALHPIAEDEIWATLGVEA
jgi:hypothetical protein